MKFYLFCLMLAIVPAGIAQESVSTPPLNSLPIKATLLMRTPAAVEVSYQIPATCTALDFRDENLRPGVGASMRKDWAAADDCTEFDGKQLRRKHPSCSTLRLRVPATTRHADRVYPWAFPVERGLYVHTGAYALTDSCGPVDWKFVVPNGTVVIDGKIRAGSAERSAADGGGNAMPTVLIQQGGSSTSASRIHASRAFSPKTHALLASTVGKIKNELGKMLPGLPISLPFIVAAPSEPGTYWGDVANRTVMRLSFSPKSGSEQEELLHSFVTHEMAHLTQPSDWNDVWKDDSATIGEGGAEFLRLVTAKRLGWLDSDGLQAELEQAVNGCVLAAAGGSWKNMRNRQWAKNPYNCGLTFYLIGLGASPNATTPLLRLRDYYAKAKQGLPTDFAQAIECGGSPQCRPHWMQRLAGNEALDAVLHDFSREPMALLGTTTDIAPVLVKSMAFRHVGLLMQGDCKGGMSMYQEAASARIGDGLTCTVLRPGMVIVNAEGLPLFEDGAALKASVLACQHQRKTVLGLADGTSITMACDEAVKLPARLYRINAEQALKLTK